MFIQKSVFLLYLLQRTLAGQFDYTSPSGITRCVSNLCVDQPYKHFELLLHREVPRTPGTGLLPVQGALSLPDVPTIPDGRVVQLL